MRTLVEGPGLPTCPPARQAGGRDGRAWWNSRWRWVAAVPLVVSAALLLTDRLLVRVAEHRLTNRLGCMGTLTGTRSVHIDGFPFLTQLAAGHFRTVTATADGFGRADRLTDLAVTFRDVRVPVWSAVLGRPRTGSLAVGSVSLTAVLRLGSDGPDGRLARPLAPGPPVTGRPVSSVAARPSAAVLPPGAHLDGVEPVPGGLRLAVTMPGAALAGMDGRTCRG
ncbi:DUF2993 domain-containing protein [Pseudofrankia sp. BMG5.37]|uniref:LmeA family phospholipid-binding protein n=1 Tax=Pseudofrankia sp. BMG5.37 TaxID=3050035 RepID=UPI00289435C4|nr:DUF2993 domain-containing protein [Pseudofrankia sp. BMG5.37]MDT3438945.1 DUF2993 domain-containing protein [Pseudofrankia sp. BMG5.37]